MQKSPLLFLCAAALALLAAGCGSNRKTAQPRYLNTNGTLGDSSARTAYMDRRVAEMTEHGMTRESATAQASREWFNQSSVPQEVPTAREKERRKAQAQFEADLAKQKKEEQTGVR